MLRAALADERGATAAEYAIMVSLIAVVIILAVTLLGTNLVALFDGAVEAISGI